VSRAAADRFRYARAGQVDGDRRVDRHEAPFLGDHSRIVDVAHRPRLEGGILVEEVVQPLRSEGECPDGLRAVELLGHAGDDAAVDEIDQRVGDQLGVGSMMT
jgi:hypothetical protein